jgi:3-hydroxyacyl-CoA dehydrogenase
MASQLALLFARQLQVPVVLNDIDQARIDKGVDYVHGEVDKLLAKKRLSPDAANRLKALVTGSLTKDAFADADFVIEAVFEEMGVKRRVFAEVEEYVSPQAILATNTSSLSVSEMAANLKHPERVVGFHFFNPVVVLPLLEVVRAEETDDATLATAFATGKTLKKSCVLTKDAPAFVFNRLVTRALGEVTAAVDEGTDYATADAAVEPLGMPMSPMLLLQLVGPAIALHTAETLHQAFPDRYGVSEGLKALVEAGKTGVYTFGPGGMTVDPEVDKLWKRGTGALSAEQVLDRAASALAEEIRLMLDEGVVAEAQDIDLCLILGGGWAFWNGGITPYLDRTGVSERVNGRRFHAPGVASLPG